MLITRRPQVQILPQQPEKSGTYEEIHEYLFLSATLLLPTDAKCRMAFVFDLRGLTGI